MRSKRHKDNKANFYIARERIFCFKKQNSRRVLPREPGGVLYMLMAVAGIYFTLRCLRIPSSKP